MLIQANPFLKRNPHFQPYPPMVFSLGNFETEINRPVQAVAEEPEPVVLQVEPAQIPQAEVGGSTQFDALEDEDDDAALAALQPKVCCHIPS